MIGTNRTNRIINFMYSDLLTGGSNFEELERTLKDKKDQGILSSIGNCHEFLTEEEEHHAQEIVNTYLKLIELSMKVNDKNSIALKVSSLCEIKKMRIFNEIQDKFDELTIILEKSSSNKESVNSLLIKTISQEQFDWLKFQHENNKTGLNLMEIFQHNQNNDKLNLKEIFNLSSENFDYGKVFLDRVTTILSHAKEHNCSVLYDAEQTYIQNIIDSSANLLAIEYNTIFPVVLQTFQAYRKDSYEKLEYYEGLIRKYNVNLGVKLVRGAYLTEENRIAKEQGKPSLIWDTIEETHNNYNRIVDKLSKTIKKNDKIIFASHNEESVEKIISLKQDFQNIFCAQLIGISDHITLLAKSRNLQTFKYIAYGNVDIMIPYLIRRAEETAIIQKLKPQNKLLNKEIKRRMKLPGLLFGSIFMFFLVEKFYFN